MKMLAFLAGELTNSAKYFSTFADVCGDDISDCTKSFGPGLQNDWRPWDYKKRITVAKKVQDLKTKLAKKQLTVQTKRNKVTTFISANKSRKEFEPSIGRIIDRAHADPLHVKNNACQLIHKQTLCEAIKRSALADKVSSFNEVPMSLCFIVFIRFPFLYGRLRPRLTHSIYFLRYHSMYHEY